MLIEPFFQDLSTRESGEDSSIFYIVPTAMFAQDDFGFSISICFLCFQIGFDFFQEEFDGID